MILDKISSHAKILITSRVSVVREFSATVKRLKVLVLLEPELDDSYAGVLERVWNWAE